MGGSMANLTYTRFEDTTDLWWNRILNLEHSSPDAEYLSPGYH
ncbi:hypothetical protein AVEN_57144-1, partial [Araneus ventricosus]